LKISFACNWGENSAGLLEKYRKQTPNDSGVWGEISATENHSESDFVVFLGNGPRGLGHSLGKTIHFRREPDFIERHFPISDAYKAFDYDRCGYHVSTWFIEKSFDELSEMEYPTKTRKISAISSSKWSHRNHFLHSTSALFGRGEIDFYGRGLAAVVGPENYKGLLNYNKNCKFNGLVDYEYSVAIENSSQRNYFTEKIIDCFLSWTIPLYWGCPNISEYFPEGSYYLINEPRDVLEAIERPIEKGNIEALKEARNLVLNEYNIWPTIGNILSGEY